MRIDQPDAGDPSEPDARPGTEAGRPGAAEASAGARRHHETEAPEAAADARSDHEAGRPEATEAAAGRSPRRETEAVPERLPRRETETAAEATDRQEARAPVSRADQIAAHLRYRETVSVTLQAAADRAAWADAVPRLRAAWEDHKERYPERARAVPRTAADGSWTAGEHRRLNPEQNAEATKAHTDLADEAGRHILPALRRLEAADPDRRLAGLEHMVKGEDRLKEKMADFLRAPGVTIREALDEVPDAVRFTLSYSAEHYSDGVLSDLDRMKSAGFELIKLKNLWHTDQYKGINSQWRTPEIGTRFEMQFHTPESLEAKELTHEAYERIRGRMVDPAEERDLEIFQRRVNAVITTPPGTDRIKDYREENGG